jgi:HEAT repeat protein
VYPLTKCLRSAGDSTKRNAILALGELGSLAKGAVPELLEIVSDRSSREQALIAAASLVSIGVREEKELRVLIPFLMLNSTEEWVIFTLHDLIDASSWSMTIMLEAGSREQVRLALETIGFTSQNPATVVIAIRELREGRSEAAVTWAANVLERLAAGQPEIIAALERGLADSCSLVRLSVLDSLGRIGPPDSSLAKIELLLKDIAAKLTLQR